MQILKTQTKFNIQLKLILKLMKRKKKIKNYISTRVFTLFKYLRAFYVSNTKLQEIFSFYNLYLVYLVTIHVNQID